MTEAGSTSTLAGRRGGGARGRGVVIGLIVLGIAAAFITYYYWTHFVKVGDGNVTGGGNVTTGLRAPAEDLEAIGAEFTDAIENDRSTDRPAEAATNLVLRFPNDHAARNLLANILLHRGEWALAYEQMLISLERNPGQAEVHLNAGTAALKLRRYDDAVHHYSQAVGLDQRNARYRVHLAHGYIAVNRFDEARGLLLAALQADSTMHEAYQGMSQLFAKQNEMSLAIEQITKAIENTPAAQRRKQVEYIREKARFLRRANRPDDALITLQSLLAKERQQPESMRELATTYAMLGRPGAAAEVYEQAMAREPAAAQWAIEAARWRIKAGDATAARRLLDQARKISPNDPAIGELMGELGGLN